MEIAAKSYLAKLLATEDITVEHQNVQTAMFDLKSRTVILPKWKDMGSDLYDMLLGHEIGHALFTPQVGWHDAASEKGQGYKSFLNVIEDARIERNIKKKYPGIVKNFYAGYKSLLDKDFFGLSGRDVQTLPLIDRINLHFKVGSMLGIKFTSEEQAYVDRVTLAETWEEVTAIADDLFEFSKSEDAMQEQLDQHDEFGEDDSDDYDTPGESSSMEQSESAEDSDEETSGAGQESTEPDDGEESNDDAPATNSDNTEETDSDADDVEESTAGDSASLDYDEAEPEAMTDTNFRNRETELVNDDDYQIVNAKFPKIGNAFVWKAKKVWDWKANYISGNYYSAEPHTASIVENALFSQFQARNKTAINLLVQQFEMKRKATALRKSRVNKTGLLNEDKLWAYKLTDDLFLSTTTVPDGKNHGMFMLVDFSGSMHTQMQNTIEQLLIQISFCKKVGIPFDVYAFTSANSQHDMKYSEFFANQKLESGTMYIKEKDIKLLQLISSEQSAKDYAITFKRLLGYSTAFDRSRNSVSARIDRYDVPSHMHLGMTPLAEATMIARDVANKFKLDNRIEVLNTIVLSDGGNSTDIAICESVDELAESDYAVIKQRYIRGKVSDLMIKEGAITTRMQMGNTLRSYRSIDPQSYFLAVLKHFKDTTGSRLINFNLIQGNKNKVQDEHTYARGKYDWMDFENKFKKYRSEGFMEITDALVYDAMYLIKGGNDLAVDDTELEVKSNSKGDLKRGFLKFAKQKSTSRQFINRFIEKVA